jgi:hypothetical protein
LDLPEEDKNVSKYEGIIIIIDKKKNIYCALLIEIKTMYKMHGTDIQVIKYSINKKYGT